VNAPSNAAKVDNLQKKTHFTTNKSSISSSNINNNVKNNSNNPVSSSNSLKFSLKDAAMAKMKALGEEWPEEEDLPGLVINKSTNIMSLYN
jgi:hypothetical protein